MVKVVNENEFKQFTESKTTLVDFYADWCGPCQTLGPILDEIAPEYLEEVEIIKVNIDEEPDLTSSIGIMSVPTMVMFKNGTEVARTMGAKSADDLKIWIDQNK